MYILPSFLDVINTEKQAKSADALSIPDITKELFGECRENVGSVVEKLTFPKYIKVLIIWEFWILPSLPTLPTLPTLPALPFRFSFFPFLY